MPDPILLAKAFATAAVTAVAGTLIFARFSRKGVADAGSALAAMVAAYAGLWILGLTPHCPPRDALDRLLVLVLPAAAIAELIALASGRIGWVARGAVAIVAAPLLLHGSVYVTDLSGPGSRAWSPIAASLIIGILAALLIADWMLVDRLASRAGEHAAAVYVTVAVLGAGLVIMLSGYATGGQVAVPLAAGLVGVRLGSVIGKGRPAGRGALGVGVVGLCALLLIGRLFAGLTNLNALRLFAAPLLAWIPQTWPASPRVRAGLRLVMATVPVVVALALAQHQFAADSAAPGSVTEGSLDDYASFGK